MALDELAGVVAITITPFAEDGSIDDDAYATLVDRLVGGGIPVVTPNGNTSEFYALSEAETRRGVDVTVEAVGGRAKVLCGVGHDVATAIAAARYAKDAGADAIMVHQPVHPYVSLDGWIEYHRTIADAVPELGVVPYVRNPQIGGVQLGLLAAACENVVGVKYAVPDAARFAAVAREAGLDRLIWVAGLAELSAPGYFAYGATGFTSGLATVNPALSLRMHRALAAGDFPSAMEVWALVRPFEELRAADESEHNVSVVKEALAQLGLCRRDVRPPSHVLSAVGRERVGEVLALWESR
jgi:4-hydroxy-tetrahydrodipicolinate synthase